MAKYITIVGGVFSACGKGLSAASLGLLLKLRGFKVTYIKFDPYICSASLLSPHEHGECFLCDDGTETDLDLGHAERILGISVNKNNICTSGTLYKELISEQEDGKYMGATIQIVPHVTDKIQERLIQLGKDQDIVLVEIGGTVGDNESFAFLEAIRQFKQRRPNDVLVSMVAPILWVPTIQELKTKPLQNAVSQLQRYGLQPDLLLCRVDRPIPDKLLTKISNLTNVVKEHIFEAPDVQSIYEIPLEFYNRQLDDLIVDHFRLKRGACRIQKYRELVQKDLSQAPTLNVAIFGKYNNCTEAYLSLKEAVYHACVANDVRLNIQWYSAEEMEKEDVDLDVCDIHAAIVPGGFDQRGVSGKMFAIRYCREKKIPFLGICLGLQCAVIEFAKNVCGLGKANSLEFDPNTPHPVIHYVEGQEGLKKKSATLRLGAYDCATSEGSLAREIYNSPLISERHRHRYEVNSKYEEQLAEKGFLVSGRNPQTGLIEMMELDRKVHPFFIGTQAHPEFKSQLVKPAPLFMALIKAAIKERR